MLFEDVAPNSTTQYSTDIKLIHVLGTVTQDIKAYKNKITSANTFTTHFIYLQS